MTEQEKAEFAAEVRAAANVVERLCRHIGFNEPSNGGLCARQMRYEADYLDRPDEPVPSDA